MSLTRIAFCTFAACAPFQSIWTRDGDNDNPFSFRGFGMSATTLGDVDGDGRAEFAFGAPASPTIGPATVFVVSGSEPRAPRLALHGAPSDETFLGRSIVSMGDIDGDGAGDFAASDDRTVLRAISGRDGHIIHELSRGILPPDRWFRLSRSGVEDVDGDGISDIVADIESPCDSPDPMRGGLAVFSGADGCLIHLARWSDGSTEGAAGDIDRDGRGDILVRVSLRDEHPPAHPTFRVLSGEDLAVLSQFELVAASNDQEIAETLLKDANGDGVADLAFGLTDNGPGRRPGRVVVLSGMDGSELLTLEDGLHENRFGASVSDAGDVDLDGCSDILVGSSVRLGDFVSASVLVFSGKTGARMRRWDCRPGDPVSMVVASAGDLDGDGFPDQFVGAVEELEPELWAGSLFLVSGFDGSTIARLGSARHTLEVAAP